MSTFYKNMENAKVEDYKTIVSNHLKHVLPLGDGIQGSKTLPFTNFIEKYYNPANFSNFLDYSYTVVRDAGKPVTAKPYVTVNASQMPAAASQLLDDLSCEILNYTASDDITSLVRNLNRTMYLADFPKDPSGSSVEVDINTFNTNNDPLVLVSLMAKMSPIALYTAEREKLSQRMNDELFNMLGILKASGNMNAYRLALKLCNISESYFALASAMSNMSTAALNIAPQSLNNGALNASARRVDIGTIQAVNINPQNNNTVLSLQGMVNRYNQDIALIAQSNIPALIAISNQLLQLGPNLSETVLNNVHYIMTGALTNPSLVYNLQMDNALISAILFIPTNTIPYYFGVAIAYILISAGMTNVYEYLNRLLGLTLANISTILDAMKLDIQCGTVIHTAIASLNPSNGNLGKLLRYYITNTIATNGPVKLANVLSFTQAQKGNTGTSITSRDIANYLQVMDPQFYGTINPEALAQFADILYNLNY